MIYDPHIKLFFTYTCANIDHNHVIMSSVSFESSNDLSSMMLQAMLGDDCMQVTSHVTIAEQKQFLMSEIDKLPVESRIAIGRLSRVKEQSLGMKFIHATSDGVIIDLDLISHTCPELIENMYDLLGYKLEKS